VIADGLDPIIHAPKRLMVMSILCSSVEADFPYLRDQLDVSESDLSKQMKALSDAKYVKVHKTGAGRGSVTRYAATRTGRKALASHTAAIRAILDLADLDEIAAP